jgi:hypothetical protein
VIQVFKLIKGSAPNTFLSMYNSGLRGRASEVYKSAVRTLRTNIGKFSFSIGVVDDWKNPPTRDWRLWLFERMTWLMNLTRFTLLFTTELTL